MYTNVSQKIKGFVKIFTIILMALLLIAGIVGAVLLIRSGANMAILWGLAAVAAAIVLDVILYYLSCFAYGFGELLEQQAIGIGLNRQILNVLRDQNAIQEKKPEQPSAAPTPTYPPFPYPNVPTHHSAAAATPRQAPVYPYPPQPVTPEPYQQPYPPKTPYGQYNTPQTQNYRTQTPYGTATGFNEDFHYEPKR